MKLLIEFNTFDWTMSQLFLSTMRESDPELSPELFVHSSSFIKAAIKILKNVHGTSGREISWESKYIFRFKHYYSISYFSLHNETTVDC